MTSLATLTTKSESDLSLSRVRWGAACLASCFLPMGLAFVLCEPFDIGPLRLLFLLETVALQFILLFAIIFGSLSVGNLWRGHLGSSQTVAEAIRNAGANPEAITALTCLTALTVIASFIWYYFHFFIHPDRSPWQRRGPGSYMLYANAAFSIIQIIFGAILFRCLEMVHSLLMRSAIGFIYYVPAFFAMVLGSGSMLGFVLMVAGPWPIRLPDTYEPIIKIVNSTNYFPQNEDSFETTSSTQSLAALYQAQQQQQQKRVNQTAKHLKSLVLERERIEQIPASDPESADLGIINSTLITRFDGGATYWTHVDSSGKRLSSIELIEWMTVLSLVYITVQLVRFVKHWKKGSKNGVSPQYFDLVVPFLGIPIIIIILVLARRRINLSNKPWPYSPSTRALLIMYHFSILILYTTDLVLMGVRGASNTFDEDIFKNNSGGLYAFVGFMGALLILVGFLGRSFARHHYGRPLSLYEYNDDDD